MNIMADILLSVGFIFTDYLIDILKKSLQSFTQRIQTKTKQKHKYVFRLKVPLQAILLRLCFKSYLQISPYANLLSYIWVFPLSMVSQIESFFLVPFHPWTDFWVSQVHTVPNPRYTLPTEVARALNRNHAPCFHFSGRDQYLLNNVLKLLLYMSFFPLNLTSLSGSGFVLGFFFQ